MCKHYIKLVVTVIVEGRMHMIFFVRQSSRDRRQVLSTILAALVCKVFYSHVDVINASDCNSLYI